MRILHTEASPGWGGQEIRILNEAVGMRDRGHELFFVLQRGQRLAFEARRASFEVFELDLKRGSLVQSFWALAKVMHRCRIDLINTHSSFDAWLGGALGRILAIPVIRTRHLSTPIRGGINSRILYNFLADRVVTTCFETMNRIKGQASLDESRCRSIPSGVNPCRFQIGAKKGGALRDRLECQEGDLVIGTMCVLRCWKGVADFLYTAAALREVRGLKWVVVGTGPSEGYFLQKRKELGLEKEVHFTGHLEDPSEALQGMDIFCLLSHGHEGVPQAALQAAWLSKPLITTGVGGLSEVCIDGRTGFIVPPHSPHKAAEAILRLKESPLLRHAMGRRGFELVKRSFTFDKTLDEMERVYESALRG